MPNLKESILQERGLQKIRSLDEIVEAKTFFADLIGAGDELIAYPTISKRGKLNLTHDLLNLYGVHWRYLINVSDWNKIRRENGDTALVMGDILEKRKPYRHATYAFTKRYVDGQQSLWIFIPNTPGWEYYQDVLIPRFQADQNEYIAMKRKAHKIGDFIKAD